MFRKNYAQRLGATVKEYCGDTNMINILFTLHASYLKITCTPELVLSAEIFVSLSLEYMESD